MKEFKIFNFIDKLKVIYTKFGVDYDVMKLIVSNKLLMDGRRTSTALGAMKKGKEDSNQFTKALWMYAFIGFFLMFTITFEMNMMYQLTAYFSTFMFLILTVFISDFSAVILDIKDKNLIASKGVSLKTVSCAKITHLFIYMMYLTMALGGFSIVASFKYGVAFGLMFILQIILIDLFMIMVTALVYFVTLKFFDGEKLKDMINAVQIILSVTMMIGMQIIPRLFAVIDFKIIYTPKIWHYIFPAMWFSAPLEIINSGEANVSLIIMSILSIIVPIASIIIYIKLAPTFEQYLEKLNSNTYRGKKNKEKLSFKVSKLICKSKEERTFFNFANNLISTERTFKLKVYPSLGLSVIFPFIIMTINMHEINSFMDFKAQMADSKSFLALYGGALMLPNIIMLIKYSEMYKGAWIYKILPIKNTESIFKGTIKAIIYRFVAPIFMLQSVIFLIIFKVEIIVQIIGIALGILLLIMIIFMSMEKALPFTQKLEVADVSANIGPVILSMLGTGLIVGFHYLAILYPFGIYVYIVTLILIDIILWNKVFKVKWTSIN